MKLSSLNTVDKTYSLLTHNSFDEAIKRIIGARKIFLGGVGGSGTVANDFYQKLTRVDHNAIFSWDNNLIISSLTHSGPDDVFICFSYSGKTREMIHLANIAKNKGATVIAVTQIGANPLARIADFVISIPKEEGEVQLGAISSRNSMFIITDLIYFSILNADFEEAKNKLLEFRKLHKAKNKLK